MIGETFGSYRVTAKIGEGGMGVVYLAEHTVLGRRAAVKVLLSEHTRSPELIERFTNEARTCATLQHPNIVEVFDFGVHANGSAFLVMAYLEGESLGARLHKTAPFESDFAIDVMRQVARGMDAAHAHGVVHRDLKPDNVFLVPHPEDPGREQVKILDFGIAKLLPVPGAAGSQRGSTRTGVVMGTPLYMAPEQCKGAGTVDHRADIYSLGCIAYHMLCGHPPFDYEGVGEILGAHLHEPVKSPREINPNIPQDLERIVLGMLAKKPDERTATMADVVRALTQLSPAASGTALRAKPSTSTRPAPTTFSGATVPGTARPRRVITLPVALALAAVATTTIFLLRPRPAPPPPKPATAPTPSPPPTAPAPAPAPTPPTRTPTPAPPPAPAAQAQAPAPSPPHPKPLPPDSFTTGVAHLSRGQEKEALESFRAYLRGSNLPPSRRTEAERHVIDLQRKFGELEVDCEVDGADVSIDGHSYGRTPLRHSILLPPGAHELQVTKDGYKPVRRPFRIGGGERQPFFLKMPR